MGKGYAHPEELPPPPAVVAAPDPRYTASINVVQSAATAAAAAVWALRNGATKLVTLNRLIGILGFVGTPASATLRYGLFRFTAATPSGGAAVVVSELDTDGDATTVADCRVLDTGLTVAGVTFETSPLVTFSLPLASIIGLPVAGLQPAVIVPVDMDLSAYKLRADEGLAIKILSVATVIGASFVGDLTWSEGDI